MKDKQSKGLSVLSDARIREVWLEAYEKQKLESVDLEDLKERLYYEDMVALKAIAQAQLDLQPKPLNDEELRRELTGIVEHYAEAMQTEGNQYPEFIAVDKIEALLQPMIEKAVKADRELRFKPDWKPDVKKMLDEFNEARSHWQKEKDDAIDKAVEEAVAAKSIIYARAGDRAIADIADKAKAEGHEQGYIDALEESTHSIKVAMKQGRIALTKEKE